MNITTTISQYLEEQRALIDQELDQILPSEDTFPYSIHKAMRYSVFAGGKRLRPILCAEAGRLFGAGDRPLLRIASALELVHTYSLIHDDLPALDNDDLRRGKPTCHRAFGEATAILTGDALLTLAYEVLSEPGNCSPERQLRIIYELAQATGTRNGMVAGQVMDLESSNQAMDAEHLELIHSSKTGAFLCASVRCGAIFAGAREPDIDRLTIYGRRIGLAFQIVDDLLDVLGSSATLGKTPGKDDHQSKATYPALYGIEESRRKAELLIEEALESLRPYGEAAERLRQLAHFLIERTA
ncbi:MAG TPA: farnesyl diphosphate synthase [Terriglobia bacterium]|nr:farnesyl diphosphate synthase [Terriglobia bacterium]